MGGWVGGGRWSGLLAYLLLSYDWFKELGECLTVFFYHLPLRLRILYYFSVWSDPRNINSQIS